MNAQHNVDRVGLSAIASFGVMTTNFIFFLFPRNQGIYFLKKLFTPGLTFLDAIFRFTEKSLSMLALPAP